MINPRFAVLAAVLCLAAVSAPAQTFDKDVADVSAAAAGQFGKVRDVAAAAKAQAAAAKAAAPAYAKTIVCAMPKESGFTSDLKFYTRLDGKVSSAVPADESAAGLDDYRRSYLDGGKFHYDAWSCDTQDYWFSFDAAGLVRAGSEASRSVKGHLRQETRGQLDWEGDLSCTAFF